MSHDVSAIKAPMVTTELIELRRTAEAASACATWYCVASMITIGIIGMAVVSTASLTMGLRQPSHRRVTKMSAGCTTFFKATNPRTNLLALILLDARIIPDANRETPPAA